jgi:hydrogenase maturation protein HypF
MNAADRVRRRFRVTGVVQGVGFRPFVYVTASELSLTGMVANDSAGVIIEVEGQVGDIDEFERRLTARAPPLAIVTGVFGEPIDSMGGSGFTIDDSTTSQGIRTLASPDVATCGDCLRELTDPADRRYRHPFITCTNCGPRFTIILDLPYDRPATTMAEFAMCAACESEYGDPTDRRFHAQPIACPSCGPRLELINAQGTADGAAALSGARAMLGNGSILAIKGLGGYHLVCDATNESAVAELRRRKQRGGKPFAVMVRDLQGAQELAEINSGERALLTAPRRPIVLLARRAGTSVAASVAPGNPDLGLLLPYTPLHRLLFGVDADGPGPSVLVMTSGNLGGEPIAYDDEDALVRLAPLVDGWLRHDRPIAVPCDDSVSRVVDDEELPIRRSRGYAPLPVALPFDVPAMLAVGADVKNTCCVAEGRYAWLSQHIGDMDDLATLQAFDRSARHLEMLTGVEPRRLVSDAHPAYRSTRWAHDHADGRNVVKVQHHHAHIASVMGEHGLDGSEPVIGFAFDGTGYGTDGAVWGGEVLVADYRSFRRAAHLAYVPLAGGDASVYRPYRMALAHLQAAGVDWAEALPAVAACPKSERRILAHQLATGFGCTPTSSMGRLFDAVSSLAGVRHVVDYEAEAAIELEGLARPAFTSAAGYRFAIDAHSTGLRADAAPVIRAVAVDVTAGTGTSVIAARFHRGVVDLVRELAERVRQQTALSTVVLSGGVFQNSLLLTATRRTLQEGDFTVLCPRLLPPNDGGLALGQILVAAAGRLPEGDRQYVSRSPREDHPAGRS